ncbi:type VII secretion target [Nocardia sp. NBC_00511]|uniref:type VII secretion target n=1 Tax=Nocardia sp. NBC_00511 TaxID=2903591 RepID=UPI002F90D3D4
MSNENKTLVVDQHELQHHSDLHDQRAAEVSRAAIPPIDHLNNLGNELGVAGAVGAQALADYHAIHRQSQLNTIADTHGAIRDFLRYSVIPSFLGVDQENGGRVNAAGDLRPVGQ